MEVSEHSAPSLRGSVVQLVMVVLIIVFFSLLLRTSLRYPYYFMWDMDEISTVDTVLINSGILPDHLNHTGFGMYLVLSVSSRIARSFNVISASTLTDLKDSLNPIACIAETTDYLRRHTPYIILAMVLALWFALRLIFGLPRWIELLALALLAFQESLFYHASMIRTDCYSIMFFCLAIFSLALAMRARRGSPVIMGIFMAGIMLGLAFLTKIQALFCVATFPFLMMLALSLQNWSADQIEASLPTRIRTLLISLVNVVAFGILLAYAYQIEIPKGYATFTEHYQVTGLAVFSGAALLALFIMQVLLLYFKSFPRRVHQYFGLLVYLASGFLFAFLLHLIVHHGATYMLYDFKVLFLRQNPFELSLADMGEHVSNLSQYAPVLFGVHFVLLGLLVIGRGVRMVQISWFQVTTCVVLTFIGLMHLLFGTRFILRDLIWVEILFNLLSLVYLALLIRFTIRWRLCVIGLALVCVTSCLATNIYRLRYIGTRINANYNLYGWQRQKWFAGVYNFNAERYTCLMNNKYRNAGMREAALAHADLYAENRRTVEFVFPNQAITLRNIGIVAPGFPICATTPSLTLSTYPPVLDNALLVDSASVPLKKKVFFQADQVRVHSERLDKFSHLSPQGTLAVLPRKDLRIILFAAASDLERLDPAHTMATGMHIVPAVNVGDPAELSGVEIVNYCEIPASKFNGSYFFVILKAFQ